MRKQIFSLLAFCLTAVCLNGCGSRDPESADEMAWKRAQQQNTVERYKAYIEIHPQGTHVGHAKEAIGRLEAEAKSKITREEEEAKRKAAQAFDPVAAAYQKARFERKVESLEAFIKEYPQSAQANEARAEITLGDESGREQSLSKLGWGVNRCRIR